MEEDYYKVEQLYGKFVATFYMDNCATDIYIELNAKNYTFLPLKDQLIYLSLEEEDDNKPF